MAIHKWVDLKPKGPKTVTAWTDYPLYTTDQTEGILVPVREVKIVACDGDKYCAIVHSGSQFEIKAGYLYKEPGRYGKVPKFTIGELDIYFNGVKQ